MIHSSFGIIHLVHILLIMVFEENYPDVEFVAYDKEYTDEALDNEEYEKKNDEIDLIEKHFNVNINV